MELKEYNDIYSYLLDNKFIFRIEFENYSDYCMKRKIMKNTRERNDKNKSQS